jgi:hypothetical protein
MSALQALSCGQTSARLLATPILRSRGSIYDAGTATGSAASTKSDRRATRVGSFDGRAPIGQSDLALKFAVVFSCAFENCDDQHFRDAEGSRSSTITHAGPWRAAGPEL